MRFDSALRRTVGQAVIAVLLAAFNAAGQTSATPCEARASIGPAASDTVPTRDTSARATPARATSGRPVDVVLFAEASAREIRFNAQPRLEVRLCGSLDSVHVLERRNLPTPVVVNTTYRDVYVAVQIFGRLNADCLSSRIEGALGGQRADTTASRLRCASLDVQGVQRSPPDSATRKNPSKTTRR